MIIFWKQRNISNDEVRINYMINVDKNKKAAIVFMKSKPIQYEGMNGRELPIEDCKLFTDDEAENIYEKAGKMERFFEDIFRNETFNEVARELFEICPKVQSSGEIISFRIKTYVRSYILEADIFIKHWERYMIRKGESYKDKFKEISSEIYDNNEAYALLSILRNYLVHSNDVIHGVHIGFDGLKIWTDRDALLNDIQWSKGKRELLERQEKKIDLLRVIKESMISLNDLHDMLLNNIITEDLRNDCKYLVEMRKRILLFNVYAWAAFKFTERKSDLDISPLGIDYRPLNWNGYKAIYDKLAKLE